MSNYLTTVRYAQTQPDGMSKTITEQYFVQDAANFADAENITYNKVFGDGDNIDVTAIKRSNIVEVIKRADDSYSDDDKWYKAKLTFTTLNEATGKERKVAVNYLVVAQDISIARNRIVDFMRGSISDYEISTLDETKIVSVLFTNLASE